MKNKIKLLVMALIASAISVISVSEASANCTAEDPCGTWAMLDNQGTVTNVIVCQASVCGGGTWAGQTVVPQVAPNPVTHDTSGQGSYIGNKDTGTTVTYSNGTFSINEPSVIVGIDTEIENSVTTVATASVPVTSRTFTYNDTVGKSYGEVSMSVGSVSSNAEVKLSIEKTENNNSLYQSTSIFGKKTEQDILQEIFSKEIALLNEKVQNLIRVLKKIKYLD